MGYHRRAVHVVETFHEQAMEMEAGGFITQVVLYVDYDLVANIRLDCRYGPLVVDADDGALKGTIGVGGRPTNIEIVGDGFSNYRRR